MKEVKAYIKPIKVSEVMLALQKIDCLPGMTLSEVRGFGRHRVRKDKPPFVQELLDYAPYIKLEIVCPDEMEAEIVATIEIAANNGNRSKGLVYVTPVHRALRIDTGERGEEAVARHAGDFVVQIQFNEPEKS